MPNPKSYKSKADWMDACMHQTVKVEGKKQNQGVAMCLNMWKDRNKDAGDAADRIASKLERAMEKAERSKKPSVFLGGECDENNDWRKEVKEEFGDKFIFLDPYDPHWEPDDNIYEELAAMTNADHIVFLKGGRGSKNEKEFLDRTDESYKSFKKLVDLKKYLMDLRGRSKRASISQRMVVIAADLLMNAEQHRLIEAQDDMSGTIHKEDEARVKLKELPEECKKVKPILIQQGVLREVKKDGKVLSYARLRMKQEPGKKPEYSLGVKNFPRKQEAETEVSKEIFRDFYPDNLSKPQKKKRYSLPSGWDVDELSDGSVVAEFERKGNQKAKIPEHWEVAEKLKVAGDSHKYSCVMVDLPKGAWAKLKALGKEIPEDELYPGEGREDHGHITVLYGLKSDSPDSVRDILASHPPFGVRLGETILFTTHPAYDVLVVKVGSPGLQFLHKRIAKGCECNMTHPVYQPHATVAYLKKGYGPKYIGKNFGEIEFVPKSALFSSSDDKKTTLPIGKS